MEKARFELKAAPVLSRIESEQLKLALEEADAAHKQLLSEVSRSSVAKGTAAEPPN